MLSNQYGISTELEKNKKQKNRLPKRNKELRNISKYPHEWYVTKTAPSLCMKATGPGSLPSWHSTRENKDCPPLPCTQM